MLLRVTFLTHYFPPELGAAPARIAALAQGLAAAGVDVTVHTGFPHYPGGQVTPPYRNRPWLVEHDGPVRVVRSAVYATPNRGTVRRLLNHAVSAGTALATARCSGPADVVVAESPPLFTAAAGVAYARIKRAPLALNVSDLWPATAIELGALRGRRIIAAATALERRCYRGSRAITAPTQGIVDALAAHPAAAGRQHLIPPAVDLDRFTAVPAAPPPRSAGTPLTVVYAGTLGLAQGLEGVLDAMALVPPAQARLVILGDGPAREALTARVARDHLGHVDVVGPVPPAEVVRRYGAAHAGLVPLRDLPVLRGALPTKLYEVLAAGRPALVAATGEAADLVTATGSGVAVPPEDPAALAQALRALAACSDADLAVFGTAARAVAAAHARPAAVSRWLELLSALDGAARAHR